MDVSLKLEEWKVENQNKVKKITGKYSIWSGSTKIADQQFNADFCEVKIPFSTELMLEVENLEKKIHVEIAGIVK